MSLLIRPGRMTLDGPDATKRFDSDDKMLHILTAGITGSQAIASISGGDSNDGGPGQRNLTTDYLIGTCDPLATFVFGSCKFNLNNPNAGLAFDRYHTVFGGVIIWVMDGEPGFLDALGDNSGLLQFVSYRFYTTSGNVYLRRRLFIRDTPNLYTVLSHTITFWLKAGAFT